MSLDNALRSALVSAGDDIPADTARALPAIARRVRAHRRRRALEAAGIALAMAAVVWAPPVARSVVEDQPQRPARERATEEPDTTTKDVDRSGVDRGRRLTGSRPGRDARPGRRTAETAAGMGAGPSRDEAEGGTPATDVTKAIVPRSLAERYEVSYLAGTHVGENAGAGCWQGTSATGSNDCIAIPIGEDESLISLRLTDDEGVVVGATVYQHVGGEGTELVSFCGSTDGYVAVEPGALLLVYLDTSVRCSEEPPHTGTLSASIR